VAVPKEAGVTFRDAWKARVDDAMALVKAVAEGKAPLAYLTVNQAALDAQARVLKGELRVPGVVAYNEPVEVRR
ncbi:MAG TPA: hypothetical protein VFT43_07335, partial [Candidatus Polarisedimenticolia bacterium]|nr:hypothetical protein [Candidatus Polarisedimenticolia bacterium]